MLEKRIIGSLKRDQLMVSFFSLLLNNLMNKGI